MEPREMEDKDLLPGEEMSENEKRCAYCKTTRTPLWRGGPAGPKSLCNACGIKYRKRRVSTVQVGLSRVSERKKERERTHDLTNPANSASSSTETSGESVESEGNGNLTESLKRRIVALGKEVLLQRSPSMVKKQRCQRRRKLGEEEQAAMCLMALSCGSVFA